MERVRMDAGNRGNSFLLERFPYDILEQNVRCFKEYVRNFRGQTYRQN